MRSALLFGIAAASALALCALCFVGCEDQSENIPNQWDEKSELVAQGWEDYALGDYAGAQESFIAANQKDALFLPAYNGLGWCAVRLTNFDEAGVQFSFITTLADRDTQVALLADAYAGLSLSASIERSVKEILGEAEAGELRALAELSIAQADCVFALQGEDYDPADHDPALGSHSLHLLCAQNYFYLLEFVLAEEQLSYADPVFVDSMLYEAGYGQLVQDEIVELELTTPDQDTLGTLIPQFPGIHHYTSIDSPPGVNAEYAVIYDQNMIEVHRLPESAPLEDGMEFGVSYVYIENLVDYLYHLLERIEELIEF